MRVNFNYTSILTKRLVHWTGITIALFAIFSSTSSFRVPSDRSLLVKELNIIIRQIGDRLLLQAGDSTSRVLPVTEINGGTFLLRFENKLNFNHDSLQKLTLGLLPKTRFASGYTVTVHDCKKAEIVYGFQVNNATPDILPCVGRNQPRGCYTIEFVFPDLFESIDQEKVSISQKTNFSNPGKAGPSEINPGKLNLAATGQITKELKSVKVDSQASNSGSQILKPPTFNSPLNNFVYAGLLVLVIAAILIWNFRKKLNPASIQNQKNTIIKESDPELSRLGKYLFNIKGQRLLLGGEEISLTDKECKVLELLHRNFGELITRETLMQEVWINEGVITGRSLDMFVSKLRKKLSHDPELRITNIHGKGYKLEMAEG